MRGLFITFEGNDGSGKSSVSSAIKEELEKLNIDFITTREPGGSMIAEKIREIILDKENLEMDPKTEALLYAASRREHLIHTVLPALKEGKVVLSDRYLDSSLVYQGIARGLGVDEIFNMNEFAVEGCLPDLTIMIAVRPEIGMSRIKKNRGELDRLELEQLSFHNMVYEGYHEIAKRFPNRIVMIDGEKAKEEVIEEAKQIVLQYLRRR